MNDDGLELLAEAFAESQAELPKEATWKSGTAIALAAGPLLGALTSFMILTLFFTSPSSALWYFLLSPFYILWAALGGGIMGAVTVLAKRRLRNWKQGFATDAVTGSIGALVGAAVGWWWLYLGQYQVPWTVGLLEAVAILGIPFIGVLFVARMLSLITGANHVR